MELLKVIAKARSPFIIDAMYSAGTAFFKLIVGLIVVKMLAVNFSVSEFGLYGQLLSFFAMLTTLSTISLQSGLVKLIAVNYHEKKTYDEFIATSFYLLSFFIIINVIVVVVFHQEIVNYFFGGNININLLMLIVFFSVPATLSIWQMSINNGIGDTRNLFLSVCVSSLMAIVVFYYIVGSDFTTLITAIFFVHLLSFLTFLCFNIKKGYFAFSSLSIFGITKKSVNALLKYVAIGGVALLSIETSRVFLRSYLVDSHGWDIVGEWQVAIRISELGMYFMSIVFTASFYPAICKTTCLTEIIQKLKHFFIFVIVPFSFGLLVIYFFRNLFLILLFDEKFLVAEKLIGMNLLGDFFRLVSFTLGFIFLAKDNFWVNSFIQLVQVSLYVGISFLMLEDGAIGFTNAYCLAFFLNFIFLIFIFIYRSRKW